MRKALTAVVAVLLVVVLLGVSGCSSSGKGQSGTSSQTGGSGQTTASTGGAKQDIVFATNPVGTGYYTTAAGQGSLLTKKTNLNVIVQPTSGPEGVVQALKAKQAKIMLMEPTLVGMFWKDDADVKQVRSLQAGNILRFSFVTHEGTGIKSVTDLKGKRVSFTGLSASHQLIAEAIMKAYGLDPAKDVIPMKMSFATGGLDDLAEGRTDAVIASIAGGKMEELASKVKPVVLSVSEDKAKEAAKYAPMLMPAKVAGKITGVPEGLSVVGQLTVLYTTKDLPESVAYEITKTLIENYKELVPLSEELAEWIPENALSTRVIYPYHPGAIKYYKEAKMWTDAMEKWQEEAMKKMEQ